MVGEVTFAVIGLLFLIADIRTFSSTFQQTFFGQSNTTLAVMATAVFATSFLAPLVGWRLGPKRGVALSAAMLGIATLIATASPNNIADLALTTVGIAGGIWWLGLLLEPPRATELGMVLVGLGLAAGSLAIARQYPRGVAAAVACAVGAALLWYVHAPVVSLVGGLVLAAGLFIAAATIPGAPLKVSGSPAVVTLSLALGWLVFVGTAFGFYAYWAYVPAVYAATALVAVAALLAPGGGLPAWRALPIALVPILVAVPLLALLLTPQVPPPAEPTNTFRVMTYNIHQGFNAGQVPSLDMLVDVISRESPDVLVLQEVVRGWMIDEQHDSLSVLAGRLAMPYVFAPNIGDLYGNAILSRFPMTDVRRVHFAVQSRGRHQPRGAVGVRGGAVIIVTTHLDDVTDSSAIRQEQVRTILREWDGEKVAIVAGDMNAEPDALEMGLFSEAGYGDLAEPAGPTTTMDEPAKRIDYIWGIGVIGSNPHTVMALGASDHRAVVVNVTKSSR